MKNTLTSIMLSLLSLPVLAADIRVTSPQSGSTVTVPISVKASSTGCDGNASLAFGYSIDSQPSNSFVFGTSTSVDASIKTIAAGQHVIRFKSWTSAGECPEVDSDITVVSAPPAPVTPVIPATAITTADLDAATNWKWNHDPGTPGSSNGSTAYPVMVGNIGPDRVFSFEYDQHGGQIYKESFGVDLVATHFVYDTEVMIADPSQVANLEMDMNHVMADGRTVILGVQCASGSKTWEVTKVANGGTHWYPTNLACDPKTWEANVFHHVQIASHHDASGTVTYDWIGLDGRYSYFKDATGPSALSLGWKPLGDMLLNFQVDGASATTGSDEIYTHDFKIHRW